MQKFYDTVFPRGEEIMDYCDQFDITDPPDDVRALMNMMYSLVAVSFAVEVWKQPGFRTAAPARSRPLTSRRSDPARDTSLASASTPTGET